MNRFFHLLFFLSPLFATAQQDSLFRNLLIGPGINVSKLQSDTLTFSKTTMPQLGIGTHGFLAKHIDLELAAQLSTRGGQSATPYLKVRNVYADILALPRVQLGERIFLGAGVQYAWLISSKEIRLGGGANGTSSQKITGYKSQLEILGAAAVQLWPRIGIEARYTLPVAGATYDNFQLAAQIRLGFRKAGEPAPPTPRDLKRVAADQTILAMKNGVLLVRLQTGKLRAEALRKNGHPDLAQQEEEKQKKLNTQLVKAIRDNFNFCPVYFFYAEQSSFVKEGKLDSLQLLGNDLSIDNTVSVSGRAITIAEFGTPDDGGTGTSVETGFLIRDTNFKQYPAPFPGFARGDYTTGKEEVIVGAVKKMNVQLTEYYKLARARQ